MEDSQPAADGAEHQFPRHVGRPRGRHRHLLRTRASRRYLQGASIAPWATRTPHFRLERPACQSAYQAFSQMGRHRAIPSGASHEDGKGRSAAWRRTHPTGLPRMRPWNPRAFGYGKPEIEGISGLRQESIGRKRKPRIQTNPHQCGLWLARIVADSWKKKSR